MLALDNPRRLSEILEKIKKKKSLKRFYEDTYDNYARCLRHCPAEGLALELGSGASFAKSKIPQLITSDILPYEGVDRVIDATQLPFADESLRLICMLNVFHHIPDVKLFLQEAQRCLIPGGRIFMRDQHMGYFSRFIYKYLHHEPCDQYAAKWEFKTAGPLSGANGALAWIVFARDVEQFTQSFPKLKLLNYIPHTPLRYWLTGGLRDWNLIPDWMLDFSEKIDSGLMRISPQFGSFVDIEVVKARA